MISDSMGDKLCCEKEKILEDRKTICLQYLYDRSFNSNLSFDTLLKEFSGAFLENNYGQIRIAFKQKVEKRTSGIVGAIYGHFKLTEKRDIKQPAKYDFIIEEVESFLRESDAP